jgi:hypothetical protein
MLITVNRVLFEGLECARDRGRTIERFEDGEVNPFQLGS